MNTRCAGFIGVVAVLFFACTEESTGPVRLNPPVDDTSGVDTTVIVRNPISIEILGSATAQVGQTVPLRVEAEDSASALRGPPTGIVWSSSDSTLIRVSSTGIVTPLRIGNALITASLATPRGFLRDTIMFTSFLSPYTFVFADTVPAGERRLILDGIQDAHEYHRFTFDRVITDSTIISAVYSATGCNQGGSAAFAGEHTITFCLGNQGWKVHGPGIKQKIVQHELFHIWQFQQWGDPAKSPAWLIEGSAELAGFRGLAAKGLLNFVTAVGCQRKESADFAINQPPGLPSLQSVESRQAFQSTAGPLYTHSMLGANFLAQYGGGGFRVYGDSLKNGSTWQGALKAAFGISADVFYGEFPAHIAGMEIPAAYLCRI